LFQQISYFSLTTELGRNPAPCATQTSCLPGADNFANCGGEGYVNAGSLFYAYDFPNDLSPNTGQEDANVAVITFVQDTAGDVWMVMTHDKLGSGLFRTINDG
jgi:hypothetical protein